MPKIAHISQPFFFPFALSPYYYFFVDYMFSRNFNPIRGVIRNMHTSVFFGFLRNTQKFMKKKHSFQFKNNLTQNSSMHYPPPPFFSLDSDEFDNRSVSSDRRLQNFTIFFSFFQFFFQNCDRNGI